MATMPHPRYDLIMAYSEALDEHGLLREDDCTDCEAPTHHDLVSLFCTTLPWVQDPAETYPGEELELLDKYARFLANQGELVGHPILTPSAVAERLYGRTQASA